MLMHDIYDSRVIHTIVAGEGEGGTWYPQLKLGMKAVAKLCQSLIHSTFSLAELALVWVNTATQT